MKDRFFVYCNESGFDTHETIEGAIEDANDRIPNYLDEGWSEDVTGVCVGKITHRAKMCDQVFPDGEIDEDGIDEAGEYWDSDYKYKCNYKMLPVEQNPAPDVQGEPVSFCEDAALSIAERTFSTEVDEQLASDIIQYAQRLHSLYTAPKPAEQQPAERTLNSDREQVTEVEAPSNSLPSWSECNLRVGNSEWLKGNDREADHDSLTANPLHEFIYEYDDSDAYKSAWFLHRLENLIGFIRSEQHPAVAQLVEALERLVLAAQCRDNSNGDQIRLIETRAELSAAAKNAEEALALYRQQKGEA